MTTSSARRRPRRQRLDLHEHRASTFDEVAAGEEL
jgi:hypothetical protein